MASVDVVARSDAVTTDLFLHPERWPLFVVGAWILGVAVRARIRRRAALRTAVGPRVDVLMRNDDRSGGLRFAAAGGALACALIAVLEPLGGEVGESPAPRGGDIVLAVDVSLSMWAADVAPNRLAVAKSEIDDWLAALKGDRIGVVAFAGEARIVAPLTSDTTSVVGMIDALEPGFVEKGGTDLGAALETSLGLLATREGDGAHVVVVTDAEEASPRFEEFCRQAAIAGVAMTVLAVGTEAGAKIPLPGGREFLKDRNGADVVTRVRVRDIAPAVALTGGRVLSAETPGTLLKDYRTSIAPAMLAAHEKRRSRERQPLHGLWIAAAVVFMMIERIGSRRRP